MILYFSPQGGISSGYLYHLQRLMKSAQIQLHEVMVVDVYTAVPNATAVKRTGTGMKIVPVEEKVPAVRQEIDRYIEIFKPRLLVCNDVATLRVFAGEAFTLNQARGSVFHYKGMPVIVVDKIDNINRMRGGEWIALQDWSKIGRWYRGEQRYEPSFSYTVCRSLDDLNRLRDMVSTAVAIAVDIETIDNWISCVGYCLLMDNGTLISFVIPFWNPLIPDGCFWSYEDEILAWSTVRFVNASPPLKILQNGAYDSAYFIKYHVPLFNYFLDTQYAWWAIYCELPRRLDFIASICLDHMTFWKEETKGDKQTYIEYTPEMVEKFWRYNALDCYYTLLNGRVILALLAAHKWAAENYNIGFRIQIGPALNIACRGIAIDRDRLKRHRDEEKVKAAIALDKIRIMVDDPDFNPASFPQCCSLMYDVLGAEQVKIKGKTRSSDEDHLKAISHQHPLFKIFAEAILACREPKKMLDIYGENRFENRKWKGLRVRGKRLHCDLNACKTVTSRFSSSKFMWEGINGQNIPEDWRDIIVADPGKLLWEIDFKQSDAWFVAFDSHCRKMVENLQSGRDLHSIHAAEFFKEQYDYIISQVEAGVPEYAHKVTGKRAISKRIGHGCNYWMAAATLFYLMGRDAVVAAAKAIGFKDPHLFETKQLIKICNRFIREYYTIYPELNPWTERLIEEISETRMLVEPVHGFARIFFGNPNDHKTMREATSQIGQGGTAGNINRSIIEIYYGDGINPSLEEQGIDLLLQVHDSFLGQVPEEKLFLLDKVLDIMEKPVILRDETFAVPTDCKIGKRWGKEMEDYVRT